ncbi:MAG: c-type cytochrome [Planctomycetes bacterium]|jgi:mono/diheme cytochrome c family protein|nr:c-type cytochrome [Planctomycetota bacterium]
MSRWIILCGALLLQATIAWADDVDAIARGKKALESRAFIPAPWPAHAYESAWKHWLPKLEKAPADYDTSFAAYYGLHPAPFRNGRYPMGMRQGPGGAGVSHDCMTCHGGSILGKSYLGLGNSSLDLQALFEDLNQASGRSGKVPHTLTNVRGTNEAFGMTIFLFSLRNRDLSVRKQPDAWDLRDDLCEDVPAWWHLKKKKTMYHSGSHHAGSVRTNMQFMLDPRNPFAVIEKEEAVFRDIQSYLFSLEAPKYPFPIDTKMATQGRDLFSNHCAECHGTYGANAKYPSKIVPLKRIGTDPTRLRGFSKQYVDFYNQTWFAKEKAAGFKAANTVGYQAPPLDGVWATAPYLHNGSVPTLYDMLNSKTRPKMFTRSFATDEAAYDKVKVGWKVSVMQDMPKNLAPVERRKIYDTTQPGRGNGGHTFGDDLDENQRWAIIEYLKTL